MRPDPASEIAKPALPEGAALRAIALTKRFELLRLWRPGAGGDVDLDDDEEDDYDGDEPDATKVDPDHLALHQVDLTVARGSMAGVVGPESAGKTTLIRLIAGTLRPTAGRIIIRGRVAPPPETLVRLLEPAHTPARNLRLVAAMLGSPQSLAQSSAPDVFAAAGLSGLERRPLQSLPSDTALTLVMAAFLHLDVDVFLFDPAPKIRSAEIRDRLFALLGRRLHEGSCALATARVEARLPDGCQYIFNLDDGRVRQSGPVGVARKAAPVATQPPRKFLGRSGVVAVGEISVTTDPGGGGTSIRVPVEVLDPAAELTFGVMLAHEGRATAKYTEQYQAATAGARLVTIHVPGQRQLAGKHRVHFSVVAARGDDKQVVLAQPIKAALRRGLHGTDAEAEWSIEATEPSPR